VPVSRQPWVLTATSIHTAVYGRDTVRAVSGLVFCAEICVVCYLYIPVLTNGLFCLCNPIARISHNTIYTPNPQLPNSVALVHAGGGYHFLFPQTLLQNRPQLACKQPSAFRAATIRACAWWGGSHAGLGVVQGSRWLVCMFATDPTCLCRCGYICVHFLICLTICSCRLFLVV
jgi:hypothetical protein